MVRKLRRRLGQVRGVEFCESCSEVCTAQCRADARIERTRVAALFQAGIMR